MVLALLLGKFAFDRDDRRLLLGALASLLLGALVVVVAMLITTPAEHARRVASSLVEAAEASDLAAMRQLFDDEASIHFGSLGAIGLDRSVIDRGIEAIGSHHRVESNTVTRRRAGSLDERRAVAEISCITTTASSFGPVPSTWLLEVELDPDGVWRIHRLACTAIAGRAPTSQPW